MQPAAAFRAYTVELGTARGTEPYAADVAALMIIRVREGVISFSRARRP
jgi:hypothetical protein